MPHPHNTLRLLTWNILHGGGPRTPEIVLSLLHHTPDIVILTEFRAARGSILRAALSDHGLDHQSVTPSPPGRNGILIASRTRLAASTRAHDPRVAPGRFLARELPDLGLAVLAVHAPDTSTPPARLRFWHALIDFAREHRHRRCVVLGDFNAGRRGQDGPPRASPAECLLGAFCSLGFSDAWRLRNPDRREYSWYSSAGGGFRIDAAYVSKPLLPSLQSVVYSGLERDARLSDHAALLLDLHAATIQEPPAPSRTELFSAPLREHASA